MSVCSECIHFQQLKSNKNIGKCTAPLPYYAKLVEIYEYVSTNDVIAEMCDCFTEGDFHDTAGV